MNLILILTILNFIIIGYDFSSKECLNLPSICKYVKYRRYSIPIKATNRSSLIRFEGIICENKFDERISNQFRAHLNGCKSLQESVLTLIIKPSKRKQIINNSSFGSLFLLGSYFEKLKNKFRFRLLNVNGFDIDSRIFLNKTKRVIIFTKFNVFKQNKLVRDCRGFAESNSFIFQTDNSVNNWPELWIIKQKNDKPICSLFFRNAKLSLLAFQFIINSFYMKNLVTFIDSPLNRPLNVSIEHFELTIGYGLDINSRLLNPVIFANIYEFTFFTHLNSIDSKVFKPFRELRLIYFNPIYLGQLIRKQGIEWIKSINSGINFDLSNTTEIEAYSNRIAWINLQFTRVFLLNSKTHFVYDHDFCLFADFPFQQLVFFVFTEYYQKIFNSKSTKYSLSCAELWLFKYYQQIGEFVYDDYEIRKLDASNFTSCQFESRLKLCNKTQFRHQKRNKLSSFDFMLIFELVLIFLAPCLGLYGVFTNLSTIYVIRHKNNLKTTNEKHYMFMCIHCAFNAIICVIQVESLVNECQYPFGLFCSKLRRIVGIQYLKIILGEFTNSCCRLLANFSYLGFSLCRLTLIGKDHSKFLVFINDLSIKKYMIFCLVVSAGLSVCKTLQFDINLDMPEYAFPLPFSQNTKRFVSLFKSGYICVTAINAIYDLFNYLIFVLIFMFVDIVLIKKLNRVLREKEEKMKEMLKNRCVKDTSNADGKNDDSKRRVFFMVVFSSLFNLVTKVPSMIVSLNDLRILVIKPVKDMSRESDIIFEFDPLPKSFSFRFLCSMEKSCVIFQNFGNCLFVFSTCSVLFFLKRFDNNFKLAYKQVFLQNKTKTKN